MRHVPERFRELVMAALILGAAGVVILAIFFGGALLAFAGDPAEDSSQH